MAENKKISGMGFHHINLKATDFDKSVKFYTEVLGMTPVCSWENNGTRVQMLDVGDGGIVEIGSDYAGQVPGGLWAHFALKVDDVEAAYNTAIAGGAESMTAPKIISLDAKPEKMNIHIAFVYGPDKEEIEFFKIVD